jgi:hypothetical protein
MTAWNIHAVRRTMCLKDRGCDGVFSEFLPGIVAVLDVSGRPPTATVQLNVMEFIFKDEKEVQLKMGNFRSRHFELIINGKSVVGLCL